MVKHNVVNTYKKHLAIYGLLNCIPKISGKFSNNRLVLFNFLYLLNETISILTFITIPSKADNFLQTIVISASLPVPMLWLRIYFPNGKFTFNAPNNLKRLVNSHWSQCWSWSFAIKTQ